MSRVTASQSARGSRHHWIPAAFIGRFSAQTSGRLRKRSLWVANRVAQEPFISTPERRAHQLGLYDLDSRKHLGGHIDHWHYEPNLPTAVEALVNPARSLDAHQWIDTLIPFVAGLWVRTPDRNGGKNNEGRIVEFQEVLAPVAAATWSVAHFPPKSLITSDRGFTVVAFQDCSALIVPLDAQTLLILSPGDTARIVRDKSGRWIAPIGRDFVTNLDAALVNQAMSNAALSDVYGPTRGLVEANRPASVLDPLVHGIPFLTEKTDLRAHFFDYFRLRAAVHAAPGSEAVAADHANWPDLGLPPDSLVAIELLRPERTRGGVFASFDRIILTLEWGRAIKTLQTVAGEAINGASTVMSVEQLRFGSRPVELGLEWSSRGMNMAAVPMTNIMTGAESMADLARLRRDIGEQLGQPSHRVYGQREKTNGFTERQASTRLND